MSDHARHLHFASGRLNGIGFWTLYLKECQRFWNVAGQSLAAPVITTVLFFLVFSIALGGEGRVVWEGVSFVAFLAPGLAVMQISQSAFANTSSSLVISKVQGNIVDVLMPPLRPWEMTAAYIGAGITRGMAVGVLCVAVLAFLAPMRIYDPFAIVAFAVLGSAMLGTLGLIAGIWSDKFDHLAAMTNFVILPLTFLSGTFYTIERLPPLWQDLAHANPFFYMIDGFRYGFIGVSDSPIWLGLAVLLGVNAMLWAVAQRMLATGYKLKA